MAPMPAKVPSSTKSAAYPPQIDLTTYFDPILNRITDFTLRDGMSRVGLLDMSPADADRMIGIEFGDDLLLPEIGKQLRLLLAADGCALATLVKGTTIEAKSLLHRHLLVGYSLGANINRYSKGQPNAALFEISPRPQSRYDGNGENSSTIGPHTDGSGVDETIDVLTLSCVSQTATAGGETLICNARQAVGNLTKSEQGMLAMPWPRTSPYEKSMSTGLVRRPIATSGEPFEFSYHPQRVRDGVDRCGMATIERLQTLAHLDSALCDSARPVKLQPGQLLLLDNRRMCHARLGFIDDRAHPRCLQRLWIRWRDVLAQRS